jgi:hypothetical protein
VTRLTLIYLAFSLFFANALTAQNASLHGRVLDESGTVVAGATVILISGGAPPSTAASGVDGVYRFDGLAAGTTRSQPAPPNN